MAAPPGLEFSLSAGAGRPPEAKSLLTLATKPKIYALTTVGGQRKANQDGYLIALDPQTGFFSVWAADGMGGQPRGAEASREVLIYLQEHLLRAAAKPFPGHTPLPHYFQRANRLMNRSNRRLGWMEPEKDGAGTTLTGIMGTFTHRRVYAGQLGDTRVYHLSRQTRVLSLLHPDNTRANEIIQGRLDLYGFPLGCVLGEDRSLLQFYYETTRDWSRRLSQMNALHGFIGMNPKDLFRSAWGHAGFSSVKAEPGDRFFFCSDGVTALDFLTFTQLLERGLSMDLVETMEALFTAVRNSSDNATVVGVEV